MATYYASPAGAGTTDGSSPENAFAGLADAFASMTAGGTHTLILADGTYDEIISLGAAVNGSTITVVPADGATPVWHYDTANASSTITVAANANAFTIEFQDTAITRSNSSNNCYMIAQTNTSAGTKKFVFTDCAIDHHRNFAYVSGAGAGSKLSITVSGGSVKHGGTMFGMAASTFAGDVVLENCTIGATEVAGGYNQGQIANLGGSADSVDSWTMDNVTHNYTSSVTTNKPLDLSYRCATVSVTGCTFNWTSSGGAFTGTSAPYYASCTGALTWTGNTITDNAGAEGVRSYAGAQHWVYLYAKAAGTIANNTMTVFAPGGNAGASYAMLIPCGAATDLAIDGNTILSGESGIKVYLLASGAKVRIGSVTANTITCDNTAATTTEPTPLWVGEASNTGATYEFDVVKIENNFIDARTGTNCGIGVFVGRDVGAVGTKVLNNTILMTPEATRVGIQYGFYLQGHDLELAYNKVYSRVPFVPIGGQRLNVHHNTFCFDDVTGGKGHVSFNQHADASPVPLEDIYFRYNVLDVDNVTAGSGLIYCEANVSGNSDVLCDYNWYALPAGDTLGELLGETSTDLAELQSDWDDVVEADAAWSGVTGNDLHSVLTANGVIRDPANGDFRPVRNLNGWGALPYLGASGGMVQRMGVGIGL